MIGISVTITDDDIQSLISEINASIEDAQDYDKELTKLARIVRAQILSGNYKDVTGRLRSDLRVFVQDNTLKIKMKEYGYYLSFGTTGSRRTSDGLTEEVANIFNKRDKSLFNKPDKNDGIAARRFYPEDIEKLLLAKLEAIID